MTADEAREDRRLKCIHLFDGECTRNCSSPEQFRPCFRTTNKRTES